MAQLINTTINGTLNVTGETNIDGLLSTSEITLSSDSPYITSFYGYPIKMTNISMVKDAFTSNHPKIIFPKHILIGYGANATPASEYNESENAIAIGYNAAVKGTYQGGEGSSYGIAIGYNATTKGGVNIGAGNRADDHPNSICFGTGSSLKLYYSGGIGQIAVSSDLRDKTDFISLDEKALEFINQVQTYTYVDNGRWNYSIDGDLTYNIEEHKKETKKGNRRHAGVKAQEVYALMKNVFGDDNYASIVDNNHYDNPDNPCFDRYFVRYESFIPFLIKSIQEQQKQIEELKTEIEKMKSL